jgi:UDP-glucose 4-epimerase
VLLYASSIGTYSPAPKNRAVDESWPVDGIPTLYLGTVLDGVSFTNPLDPHFDLAAVG